MTREEYSKQEIKEYYNEIYYGGNQRSSQSIAHLRRLASRVGVEEGHCILDVGCGTGEWLAVCAEMGASVWGVDISDKAIAKCRSGLPYGEFYAQSAERLPFEKDKFDIIACLGSLEHFLDARQALSEMSRVARKNAKIILLVPNAEFLTRKFKLFGGTDQKNAKEVVATMKDWEALFLSAGIEVIEKWKDLHVLSWNWIMLAGFIRAPLRALQAVLLAMWPLRWQYQIYYLCRIRD